MNSAFISQSLGQPSLLGTVLAVQANFYWVKFAEPPDPNQNPNQDPNQSIKLPLSHLLCTRRARLKKIGQQVMVGDQVRIEEPDWQGERGAIAEVFPRHSQLDRPPIANVDQILLVFALSEPTLDPIQLSRFLVKAESTGIMIQLCLNKSDLVTVAEQQAWQQRLQQWGYDPVLISLKQHLKPQSLAGLEAHLADKITVVSGPSGVGKSSLINHLIPATDLRTSAVSGKLGRGRHTTRHVELFELPTGGLLADTPGFNQPDLTCSATQLATYFPEIQQRLSQASCQFSNCLHREEPDCAVRGEWERYPHYLTFLEEVIAYQQSLNRRSDEEATTKFMTKQAGQLKAEPKLAAKRYRRTSRNTEKQSLRRLDVDELTQEADY
jgi:ribosome biogenesis GTPase / thiamine phosphate phosphatase